MNPEQLKQIEKEASIAALKVFPYTNEGSLEDCIDNSKRNIYDHGYIKASSKSFEEIEGLRERVKDNLNAFKEDIKGGLENAIDHQEQEDAEEYNRGREDAFNYALKMIDEYFNSQKQ